MSKRNFSFLVIGVVAALGLACVPSHTVAEIEEQIAALEADIEYLKTPLTAARMRQRGLSVMPYLPASWWHALEPCARSEYRMGRVSPDCTGRHWQEIGRFLSYCTNEPQCKVALDTLIAKRNELGELEDTMFDLELEQAELELDQELKKRER